MLWVSAGLQPWLTLEFPEELSNLAHELSSVPVSWLLASPILLVSYVLGAGTTSELQCLSLRAGTVTYISLHPQLKQHIFINSE